MTAAPPRFVELVATITQAVAAREIEPDLASFLSEQFPTRGQVLDELSRLCRQGAAEGWLCAREAGGIRYGRVIAAGAETHEFSVDVVHMNDVVGPHHTHPNGEIDLVMPLDERAEFDGVHEGWKVYPPGSSHSPTVTGGEAYVLYLLPAGAIEFTGR